MGDFLIPFTHPGVENLRQEIYKQIEYNFDEGAFLDFVWWLNYMPKIFRGITPLHWQQSQKPYYCQQFWQYQVSFLDWCRQGGSTIVLAKAILANLGKKGATFYDFRFILTKLLSEILADLYQERSVAIAEYASKYDEHSHIQRVCQATKIRIKKIESEMLTKIGQARFLQDQIKNENNDPTTCANMEYSKKFVEDERNIYRQLKTGEVQSLRESEANSQFFFHQVLFWKGKLRRLNHKISTARWFVRELVSSQVVDHHHHNWYGICLAGLKFLIDESNDKPLIRPGFIFPWATSSNVKSTPTLKALWLSASPTLQKFSIELNVELDELETAFETLMDMQMSPQLIFEFGQVFRGLMDWELGEIETIQVSDIEKAQSYLKSREEAFLTIYPQWNWKSWLSVRPSLLDIYSFVWTKLKTTQHIAWIADVDDGVCAGIHHALALHPPQIPAPNPDLLKKRKHEKCVCPESGEICKCGYLEEDLFYARRLDDHRKEIHLETFEEIHGIEKAMIAEFQESGDSLEVELGSQ